MKRRTYCTIALLLVLSVLLTSCGSKLSESDIVNIINADVADTDFADGFRVNILHTGKCKLSSNQKAESGADARWVVSYNHLPLDGKRTLFTDLGAMERIVLIERVNGQWIVRPSNGQGCN